MAKYQFLSPEWMTAVQRLHAGHAGGRRPRPIRINQVVTDVPFAGTETLETYIDAAAGAIGFGRLADPDLTLTLDYVTAKAVCVEGRPQLTTLALAAGRIKVEGDIMKLTSLFDPDPDDVALAEAIRSITH